MSGRRDELSDLGRDFDTMATRLGSLIQSQTKLLHHVSHELRSPLARMQMALGLVRQNPDKVHEFIDRVELETNRIDNLVGELLELSRLDSGVTQVQKKKFDLNQVIYSIVEDAQFEATEKNIKLHLKLEQSCEYEGQSDLMYRAIENVVRNAIKYGVDGGEVNIACTYQNTDKCLHIVVCDNGTGVDELELEDIFKPFVRGLSGSQTEGHGVGLAITKQVLEAHGGKVFARNLKPKGFCVEMVLPC
jgi:signal transduction histidine kinase